MRFAANILTPLVAFCLLGSASDCAAQEKHVNKSIIQQADENGGRVIRKARH